MIALHSYSGKRDVEVRILIVEDELKLARFLKKGLEEEHHRVTLAHDGADGLELAKTSPFDVIVLDVMLPGIDGFEVARRLRQSGTRTPILMLTARVSPHERGTSFEARIPKHMPNQA